MEDIIDIHSHILPGIDDGAASAQEALRMLREAGKQGIREVVATPHYSRHFQNNRPQQILDLCTELQEAAGRHRLNVRIHPGQEIMYSENIPRMLAEGELLTMAGSRYVLVEFYPGTAYMEITRAVRMLVMEGFSPIIAHVERCHAVRDTERIEELTKQGALMQMNFTSVCGSWMDSSVRWCRKLLKEEYIHFMGTDMHNMSARRPETAEAVSWIRKRLDPGYMREILRDNAAKVIGNEKII